MYMYSGDKLPCVASCQMDGLLGNFNLMWVYMCSVWLVSYNELCIVVKLDRSATNSKVPSSQYSIYNY